MSLTWLIVGAMVGAIGGLRTGRLVELASGVLGGMIVLPIAGVLLGLIGGDAKGSVVGAVGGLMGCWLAKPTGVISIDAVSVQVVVIFGALAGATCVLYLRCVRWSYGILFRRACQLVDRALALCGAPALAGYFGVTNERTRNPAHLNRPGTKASSTNLQRTYRGFESAKPNLRLTEKQQRVVNVERSVHR